MPKTIAELRALLSPQRIEGADLDRAIAPAPVAEQQPSSEYQTSSNLKKGLLGEESSLQDAAARGAVVWSAHLNIKQVNRGGADAAFLSDDANGKLSLVLNDNKVKNDGKPVSRSTALVENRSHALEAVKTEATKIADDASAPADSRKVAMVVESLIDKQAYQFEISVNGATRSTPTAVSPGLAANGVRFVAPRVDPAAPNQPPPPPEAPDLGSASQPPPASPPQTPGAPGTTTPTGFK